jgi:hypothetical protein
MKWTTTKINEMIVIFFLTLNIQLCTNRTEDVLHTNYIALRMKLNIGHITNSMAR